MKFLKVIFSFLIFLSVVSCLQDEPGIEQYYGNRDEGIAFLEANKNKSGIVETESGLQYEELVVGLGDNVVEKDIVKARYKYSLIDGTVVYDSELTDIDDIDFTQVNLFVLGIKEGLQLMHEGSHYKFYIPFELAYKDLKVGVVDPFSVIILEVEMLKIGNPDSDFLKENILLEGIMETESGLQYKIISEAEGTVPSATSSVRVNYTGSLIDGTVFDSTTSILDEVEIKTPVEFNLQRLIPGFTEAVQLMNEGSVYEIYIPFYLGYGARADLSDIPAYSTLVFEIELVEILN